MVDAPANRPGLAATAAVTAALAFAIMDALAKSLTANYPVPQVMFARSAVALALLVALMPMLGGYGALRVRRPVAHVTRSLAGLAAMGCFFMAFRDAPMVDVYVVGYAAPLFVTVLSVPLLRERVDGWRWGAVSLGFVGVLIAITSGGSAMASGGWAGMFALFGAVFYALTVIAIRALTPSSSALGAVFMFLVVATVVTGVVAWPMWRPIDWNHGGQLFAIGATGLLAQAALTWAFRLGAAAVVAPFEYTGLLWVALIGWFIFGDPPSAWTLLGGCVIIVAGWLATRPSANAPGQATAV